MPDAPQALLPPPLPEWGAAGFSPRARTLEESDIRSMRLAGYALFAYVTLISLAWLDKWVMSACLVVIIIIAYRVTVVKWGSPLQKVPLMSTIRAIGIQILLVISMDCAVASIMGGIVYLADLMELRYCLDQLDNFFTPFELSAVSFVNIAVLTPFAEELFFRGYFLRNFRAMGSKFAIGLTSVQFASLHMMGPNQIYALLSGILWGRLSIRYESLLPSIAAHSLTNALTCLIMLSQLDIPSMMASLAARYGGFILIAPLAAAACSLWLFVRMSRRVGTEIPPETPVMLEPGKTAKVIFHWPLSLILILGVTAFTVSVVFILAFPIWMAFFATD
jgi:membrane protease YdiL (CAAX protease family)